MEKCLLEGKVLVEKVGGRNDFGGFLQYSNSEIVARILVALVDGDL